MESIRHCTLIILALMLCLANACENGPSAVVEPSLAEKKIGVPTQVNLNTVVTTGNHTYIPINISNSPNRIVNQILTVLDRFENARPELEVTSWFIEKQQNCGSSLVVMDEVYGLWVNHRPRQEMR